MKLKDVDRLYDSMNPNTLAVMAFESLIKGDRATVSSITKSVPRYNYNAVDVKYRSKINRFYQIASLWSIEYWKCNSKMLAFTALSLIENDKQALEEVNAAVTHWQNKLKALVMMLDQLNESYGLDTKILPYYAGVSNIKGLGEDPNSLPKSASIFYDNYLQLFKSLLDTIEIIPKVETYFAAESLDELIQQ